MASGRLLINLWTDGASSGAPGLGGWAAIIDGPTRLGISGFEPSTTNNRMELKAVIEGLKAITERAQVIIWTDSSYVKNAHTQGWLIAWQKNGWISSRGDPVANQDLWRELIPLVSTHIVRWKHVKGHGSSLLNNLADGMAVEAKKLQRGTVVIL